MITFKIKRYNPEKQAEPYFEEFQLDVQDDLTLLDCMNEIKWTLDGSLTYRMSCRSAICGSCAVKANGHAILACQRQAQHLVKDNDTIVLEPLGTWPTLCGFCFGAPGLIYQVGILMDKFRGV